MHSNSIYGLHQSNSLSMQLKVIVVSLLWRTTIVTTAFRNDQNIRHLQRIRQRPVQTHPHYTVSSRFYDHKCHHERKFQCLYVKPLYLVPIRSLNNEVSLLSTSNEEERLRWKVDNDGVMVLDNTSFELSLMEENDIGNVAQFIVRIFGGDAINLSQNLTTVERLILSPAVDVVNGYSSLVAFAEVYAGLRSRLSYRFQSKSNDNNKVDDLISPPNLHGLSREEQIRRISSTSIVIVLATKESQSNDEDQSAGTIHVSTPTIIASVELRLQPCDAKIPFTLPWIDRIERKLFSSNGMKQQLQHDDFRPYLSNLCVDEMYRGRGIGKLLVHCVETIATTYWGYQQMYLHVDLENVAAVQLYKKYGYTDVGRRWNPFWAGRAADIGYFVKNI